MKATEVRILPALDPGESYIDTAFVLVETTVGDDGEAATTIEHVVNRIVGGRVRWHVVTIGQSVPLSHAGALEWAVSFAASRDVPIVYQRDDSRGKRHAAASSARSSAASSSAAK